MDYSSLFLPACILTPATDYDYDLWFTPNKIHTDVTHLCPTSHSMYNIPGPLLDHSSHVMQLLLQKAICPVCGHTYLWLCSLWLMLTKLSLSVPGLSLTYSQSLSSLSSFSYIYFPLQMLTITYEKWDSSDSVKQSKWLTALCQLAKLSQPERGVSLYPTKIKK